MTPNDIRTDKLPVMATATTKTHAAARWTTVTMWYLDGPRRNFLVEVYGGTTVAGEQNRRRRRRCNTIEECLAFLDPGKLEREVRKQARSWWKWNGTDKSLMPAARATVEG